MEKLKDCFLSFKLGSLYPSFHAAFFIGLVVVTGDEDHYQECSKFQQVVHTLWWVHLIGGLQ
jgi:hypothetical protein